MIQEAKPDLFNPLVPKAHNSECQKLLFHLQIKPVKVSYVRAVSQLSQLKLFNWRIFIFWSSALMGN